MCGVCKGFEHEMADCPFVKFSANVTTGAKPDREAKGDEEEDSERAKAEREK